MKFIAFVLALVLGFIIWAVPAILITYINKTVNIGGILFAAAAFLSLIWIVRKFYVFFLKKFGYGITDDKKDEV